MARRIGIMQGRLSPPIGSSIQAFPGDTWRAEFGLARDAGLDHIEWIFDQEDFKNPLATDEGLAEIRVLSEKNGIEIISLCADYFMSELLLEGTEAERASRAKKLKWLMERSSCAGIRHIVLPFVDNSAIKSALLKDRLVGLMRGFLADLTHFHLEFHLETSLAPAPFAALLEEIGSPLVKVNYDSGNSASLGYDSSEEMEAYGHRIGSIHIKDRVRGGKTVPLGHGAVDFSTLRHEIGKIDYLGNFVLQAARGRTGEEVEWARQNAAFARHHLGI